MWEHVIEGFARASAANRTQPLRSGNVVRLPPDAEAIIAGDLHGHAANLMRIQSLAGDLTAHPRRHVVLQELIHQIPQTEDNPAPGGDRSHHVLARVVRWQIQFPGQVHVILGNHELSQMTGQDILKWGTSICRGFADAVTEHYAAEGPALLDAMYAYFASLPLAVCTAGGLVVVHSLPAERHAATFDATIFNRSLAPPDLARTGPVYQLLWGRNFSRSSIDCIKKALGSGTLVLGHQPQPTGVQVVDFDALIIASDHGQGVVLRVGPGPAPNARRLAESAIPLASIPAER